MLTVWKRPALDSVAGAIEYVLGRDVVLVLVDDGTARLLDMGGGFFALPAVGAQMLRGTLEQGRAATVQDLARRYQVDPDRIQTDLDTLLDQLRLQGILQQRGQSCPGRLELAVLLIPCLWLIRSLSFGRFRAALVLTLAKLATTCFGWARTIAAWQRGLGRSPATGHAIDEPAVRVVDQLVRRMAASHPLPMACKERALACWALARWVGVPASLIIGVELFPLVGHCWCEAGSLILSDYDDNCAMYTPVVRYELLS